MAQLLIWHGYLLGGTGSNIYSANIAAAWVQAGHDVVLMCQDPDPDRFEWVHEVCDVSGADVVSQREVTPGGRAAQRAGGRGSCMIVRADLGGLLPVYVVDRYAGWEVQRLIDLPPLRLEAWSALYAAAMAGVIERERPAGALLNHAVPGPPIFRPVLEAAGVPYVIKVHGSELEYAIAHGEPELTAQALDGMRGARSILVGSSHIAQRTLQLIAPEPGPDRELITDRMIEVPPGVDLELFQPTSDSARTAAALTAVLAEQSAGSTGRGAADALELARVLDDSPRDAQLCRSLHALHGTWNERDPDVDIVAAIERLNLTDPTDPTIVFVGKFIRQKGVHILVAALPLVRMAHPSLRVVIAGFGPQREGLEALLTALDTGDVSLVRAIAHHGALLDDGPDEALPQLVSLTSHLDATDGWASYLQAAQGLRERTVFTGLVDHQVLAQLWPLCEVSVVPSVLPEAFGMVSAEAAACGCVPIVAGHSGLATVAAALEQRYPDAAPSPAFDVHAADAVQRLAARMTELLSLDERARAVLTAAARTTVVEEWSWESIATRIIDEMVVVPVD